MADPLTILAGASAGAGLLGSLFGGGEDTLFQDPSPEVMEIFELLRQRAQGGDSAQRRRLSGQLSNEAGALGALQAQRLGRAGASAGAVEAGMGRLNSRRLGALGQGLAGIEAGALGDLAAFAPNLQQQVLGTRSRGQGFNALLGGGLDFLLNRPGQVEGGGDFTVDFDELGRSLSNRPSVYGGNVRQGVSFSGF